MQIAKLGFAAAQGFPRFYGQRYNAIQVSSVGRLIARPYVDALRDAVSSDRSGSPTNPSSLSEWICCPITTLSTLLRLERNLFLTGTQLALAVSESGPK
jgi:hypothetical protein